MAPGGIEPSHAASKAAALSAELRGRARVAEGTRTPDHRDHNPGLYRLSYRHHAQSIVALALPQLESRHHTAAPGSGSRSGTAAPASAGAASVGVASDAAVAMVSRQRSEAIASRND